MLLTMLALAYQLFASPIIGTHTVGSYVQATQPHYDPATNSTWYNIERYEVNPEGTNYVFWVWTVPFKGNNTLKSEPISVPYDYTKDQTIAAFSK